jgi:hypothetical protein
MLLFNILVTLMSCMVTIAIGSALFIILIKSNNIALTQNYVIRNARIHLHILRNNAVGIEPVTADSTICSEVDSEEKRGPELV